MTELTTLYAVVPHLPDAPDLSVLNMSQRIEGPLAATGDDIVWSKPWPAVVDLVTGWNPDEAAHIEAVTGWIVEQTNAERYGLPYDGIEGVVVCWPADPRSPIFLRDGVVAARFHVTGCHPAVRIESQGRYRHVAHDGPSACLLSPWSRLDDGLWHWTGHAEKVQP